MKPFLGAQALRPFPLRSQPAGGSGFEPGCPTSAGPLAAPARSSGCFAFVFLFVCLFWGAGCCTQGLSAPRLGGCRAVISSLWCRASGLQALDGHSDRPNPKVTSPPISICVARSLLGIWGSSPAAPRSPLHPLLPAAYILPGSFGSLDGALNTPLVNFHFAWFWFLVVVFFLERISLAHLSLPHPWGGLPPPLHEFTSSLFLPSP